MLCCRTKSTKFAVTLRVHNSQNEATIWSFHKVTLQILVPQNACQKIPPLYVNDSGFENSEPKRQHVELFIMNCGQTARLEIVFVRLLPKFVTS